MRIVWKSAGGVSGYHVNSDSTKLQTYKGRYAGRCALPGSYRLTAGKDRHSILTALASGSYSLHALKDVVSREKT